MSLHVIYVENDSNDYDGLKMAVGALSDRIKLERAETVDELKLKLRNARLSLGRPRC